MDMLVPSINVSNYKGFFVKTDNQEIDVQASVDGEHWWSLLEGDGLLSPQAYRVQGGIQGSIAFRYFRIPALLEQTVSLQVCLLNASGEVGWEISVN